jgi:hypothetical protein
MNDKYDLETIINPSFKRPSALRSLLPTIRASKNGCNNDKIKDDCPCRFRCYRPDRGN